MRAKIVKASLFLLIYAGASWAAQPFTILFFNDFHAHLEPFEVPGFETSGHGSWDLKETVMAFDGKRGPAPEAADR